MGIDISSLLNISNISNNVVIVDKTYLWSEVQNNDCE